MSAVTEGDHFPAVVASAAAGDEAAFARLVVAYDDDLVRVAYLVTSDVAMAHESAQAAWATAWRKLRTVRDPSRVRPWLVAVCVNEARQALRRKRRQGVREIPIDAAVEDSLVAAAYRQRDDRAIDLAAALLRLADDDRAMVAMRYALGLTSDEIGRAMGMSAAGVRSRLARALAKLRKDLDDA